MRNSPNVVSYGSYTRRRYMRWNVGISWSIAVCLLSLSACQTPPRVCDCGEETALYKAETKQYLQCLEDKGNLRQQLKAMQERK